MLKEHFTITRRIEIDAAHRVPDHGSKCFHLHGHRYVIEARCTGTLFTEGEQKGMVLDFGFLKDIMIKHIHDPCDHGIIIYNGDLLLCSQLRIEPLQEQLPALLKVQWLQAVPTAENLARYWYCRMLNDVKERSEGFAVLTSLTVWETPNCKATYPAT